MKTAAIIVTRGNVGLTPVLESLPADWQQIVWDNSQREDLSVYGRYAAIENTDADRIYVQDDDCILPPESFHGLLAAWQPGHVIANMPARFREHYSDSCLVGFGAMFERDLPARAFGKFTLGYGIDRMLSAVDVFFQRTCDVVFTTLTPRLLVDVPYTDREFASDPDRMWKQPSHFLERRQMLELARQVRDA